ncbi:MAG: hypothetical protein JWO94_3691 [Verrucomicrobiaceae bacterium]|nr:hypothetical protein [Verrucomicrobiaceae bacterium]
MADPANPLKLSPAVAARLYSAAPGQGGDDTDYWSRLLGVLRTGRWIDLEVVLGKFEAELKALEEKQPGGDAFRAMCLAKLRLAMIQAQVQSAPEAYVFSAWQKAVLDFAYETERFLDLFGSPEQTAADLLHLSRAEHTAILVLIEKELGPESRRGRSAVKIAEARLATPPRMIRRTQPKGREFVSKVLMATEECASGAKMPTDVMQNLWPVFQKMLA